jgi:hypothetical protein
MTDGLNRVVCGYSATNVPEQREPNLEMTLSTGSWQGRLEAACGTYWRSDDSSGATHVDLGQSVSVVIENVCSNKSGNLSKVSPHDGDESWPKPG